MATQSYRLRTSTSTARVPALGYRWRDFDPYMLMTTLVLMAFGVVAIWSAKGMAPLTPVVANDGVMQAAFGGIGLVLMVLLAKFDYRFLATFAWFGYALSLVLLLAVHVPQIGSTDGGAQRWIWIGPVSFQPSEFGKIATLVALSTFVASRGAAIAELGNFLVSILIVAVPMTMVFLEPDLGSSLVYGAIWLAVMLISRTRRAYFVAMAFLAPPAFVVAWKFIFQDYQKERLLISYNPSSDPTDRGYNIIQSRISIGAGGWFGDGIAGGTQSQLNLLSVRESDFIFSHVSGMFGFVGMLALFASFIILLWRCLRVVEAARDSFGQCLAVGISGMLFFQAFVNIGMNVGLMPVTGITLPFISEGSTSLWTFLMAEGILQSVLMHRRKLAFQPH